MSSKKLNINKTSNPESKSELKSKLKAFIALCIPLVLAKFWQETVYIMSYVLEKDFGVSATAILGTAPIQPFGVAIGYITTAFFVDKFGVKKMLSAGLIIMSAFILLFSQTSSVDSLYIYRFCIGFIIGLIYNCSFGALPIIFDSHELPKKTSVLYMFAFASTLLSPQLLTLSESFFSWRILLLIIMALTIFSAIFLLAFFPQHENKTNASTYFKNCFMLIKNRTFLLMAIVSTLCMGGFYGFVNIFIQNLQQLNANGTTAKFIIADMQFVGRLIIFCVTTWSGYKLTQQNIPTFLKYCLSGMALVAGGLLLSLHYTNSLFFNTTMIESVIEQASHTKHIWNLMLPAISGAWLFWIYAGFMGIAQPANKSKALSIAGKNLGGTAQALLGFCLSIGEVFFVKAATYSWPTGASMFLLFIILASFIVITFLKSETK